LFQTALLVSLLTLGAVAADHLVAPVLFSSSPLWALAGFLLLAWRRSKPVALPDSIDTTVKLSPVRIALFAAAHLALLVSVKALDPTLKLVSGTLTTAGWLVAALKLVLIAPTGLLLPRIQWRAFIRFYRAELVAALVVLFTFFPVRAIAEVWPWYGQVLGRFVFHFARFFVPSLSYVKEFTPTLVGPDLDVTILQACSGINGVELFDYLFAFVVFLDWNRLRRVRTLIAYCGGVAAILVSNALRITSFVVFGNRGFADVVARFHISAGWMFFSAVFLIYLCITYPRLLVRVSVAHSASN
jgi:exosortase/archaeosortase family protein